MIQDSRTVSDKTCQNATFTASLQLANPRPQLIHYDSAERTCDPWKALPYKNPPPLGKSRTGGSFSSELSTGWAEPWRFAWACLRPFTSSRCARKLPSQDG